MENKNYVIEFTEPNSTGVLRFVMRSNDFDLAMIIFIDKHPDAKILSAYVEI